MKQAKRVTKAFMLWTILLPLGTVQAGAAGAAQPGPNDPLRIIPADSLFAVEINKFAPTLSQVDQFLTGISPVGVSMPVRSHLAELLGQPEPAGINMEGNVAVFWPLPGGPKPEPKRVGVLIPLSNFQQFLTNPNVTKPDAQGIVQIGPPGKANLAGVQLGSYLLVTRLADQQTLAEAKNWTTAAGTPSLAQRLSPDELKRATGAPVWVYANIQVANKMFGPTLQEKIKEAQKRLQEMQPMAGQPMPIEPQTMVGVWTNLLNSFLQEIQFVSLVVDPSASALRLTPLVAAVPTSETAKVFSASGAPLQQPSLVGYMENGAITTGVARLSPALVRAIALKRVELFTALMGSSLPKETVEQLRTLTLNTAEALGTDAAWAFLPALQGKPPFTLRYVATVRDKQKLNDVLEQSTKLMNDGMLSDMVSKFGVKMQFSVKRKVETYKDVPIDAIHIAIQPTDANSAQGKMIQAAYGQGLDLRLAVVNSLFLYTLSAHPQQDIQALIDRAQAGGTGQVPSEVQSALQLIPNALKSNFFGTYNYVRAIQMAMTFLPTPAPPMELPAHGDIAFAGDIGNGRILTNLAIPKQQILEIKEALGRIQQKKMQEMQKQQPSTQEQPGQSGTF